MNPPLPDSNRRAVIILAVGLLIGLVGGLIIFADLPTYWPWQAAAQAAAGTPAPAAVTGAPAPDFTLKDLAGQPVRLSALKGQVVLINFWATWCIPCKQEMPAIQQKYNTLARQGFTVVAVNLDEPAPDVKAYADGLGLSFPIVLDPGAAINDLYRVRGYPTSFFVQRDGVIAREQVGGMTDAQLATFLAELNLKDEQAP